MKFTYLGTAAAEGFPAIFCNCEHCQKARELGGKNIRTRSQAIVNDELLVDFPADTYFHFLNNNIEGHKIKYLLITHSHTDHFYPDEFLMRGSGFASDMEVEKLKIYCNKGSFDKLTGMDIIEKSNIEAIEIKPFEPVQFGNYTVTALPAKHFEGDGSLIYIISDGSKTILYANDTGAVFVDYAEEYLKKNNIVFDMVSLDCTYVEFVVTDGNGHMGLENNKNAVKRLKEIGAVTEKTQIFINHFSHFNKPLQAHLENLTKPLGFDVAYDGLKIEI